MENKIKPLQIGGLTADVPIVQGGMGVGISLSKLAGSVAANGGVGILSAARLDSGNRDLRKTLWEQI